MAQTIPYPVVSLPWAFRLLGALKKLQKEKALGNPESTKNSTSVAETLATQLHHQMCPIKCNHPAWSGGFQFTHTIVSLIETAESFFSLLTDEGDDVLITPGLSTKIWGKIAYAALLYKYMQDGLKLDANTKRHLGNARATLAKEGHDFSQEEINLFFDKFLQDLFDQATES